MILTEGGVCLTLWRQRLKEPEGVQQGAREQGISVEDSEKLERISKSRERRGLTAEIDIPTLLHLGVVSG